MKNIFVFDVESTNLHGIGFAVGAIVTDSKGVLIDQFELLSKEGLKYVDSWVKENVIPVLKDMPTVSTNRELRDKFYSFYMKHKNNCEIWSDCCFPVETNFLSEIVNDDPFGSKQWDMPYPLKDISTIVDIEIDRIENSGLPNLRKHHPLDDAKASLCLLLEYKNKL